MTLTAAITDTCDDVLIGGTISGSTLSGGVSVANVGLSVLDYGALWGSPGFRGVGAQVVGQPGLVPPSRFIADARRPVLTLVARALTSAGVASTTAFDDNMSALLGAFTDPAGTIIEWVRADGTSVWLKTWKAGPVTVTQLKQRRTAVVSLLAGWPYWQTETLNTDTVNGAGVTLSPTIGGDVDQIANPTMVFAGDGYFEDDTTGLRVTVSGSSSAVTVGRDATSGRWRVTQSGSDAPGLASWNDNRVMVLSKGGTFTSTVSTELSWRDQYA